MKESPVPPDLQDPQDHQENRSMWPQKPIPAARLPTGCRDTKDQWVPPDYPVKEVLPVHVDRKEDAGRRAHPEAGALQDDKECRDEREIREPQENLDGRAANTPRTI